MMPQQAAAAIARDINVAVCILQEVESALKQVRSADDGAAAAIMVSNGSNVHLSNACRSGRSLSWRSRTSL